ncbi:MAG: uncharacterized protein QOI24_4364 [Acidobacteriota bacterium]|jgi:predicted nucleic acid-binding protein|nr:uncharacterized protein [Acidobacteriota bacterium]
MKFWDSSALFPLIIEDVHTLRAQRILSQDDSIVSSFITPVEISSSIWRRRHAKLLSQEADYAADLRFAALSNRWVTLGEIVDVTDVALSVVSRHALRAGDAIQLAAALVASAELSNRPLDFVTFDNRLATAARAEGFAVLT